MPKIYNTFENEGYIILNNFIKNKNFVEVCKKLKKDILNEFDQVNKKSIGGLYMGNLGVQIGNYDKIFLDLLINEGLENIIFEITKKKLTDYDIFFGGNLNLSGSYDQHFHTDETFHNRFILVNIATENIDNSNGPIELALYTHNKIHQYWRFALKKQKTKKINLKQGDILIRKSELWHRGTKNNSENPRFLLSLSLKKKREPKFNTNNSKKKIEVCSNFFSNTLIGKIEEKIYTKLRYIYILLRFLKSFFKI